MPRWWNWYTHTLEVRDRLRCAGSSPALGTDKEKLSPRGELFFVGMAQGGT